MKEKSKITITKEQFNEYMEEHWNEHFYKALVECVREELFPVQDEKEKKEYREELKQLIWEAVSQGVKDYLEEYQGEAVKIIAKEFLEEFSSKDISINFK